MRTNACMINEIGKYYEDNIIANNHEAILKVKSINSNGLITQWVYK